MIMIKIIQQLIDSSSFKHDINHDGWLFIQD